MPEPSEPTVLLIGECQSPQFRRALSVGQTVDVLKSETSHGVRSLSDAIALVAAGEFVPDLVIAYQSIPDEHSSVDIDHLIGMLPLSRFVVAFSPWCESIGRTEQRWPSAWSVPLAHAAARIRFELRQLTADTPPLPATTSRDEAFATLAAGSLENADRFGEDLSASVVCDDVPLKECFEQMLNSVGFETADAAQRPDLYVVVAAFIDDKQLRIVKEICANDASRQASGPNSKAATVLVASDMATPADRERLLEAGAAAVISQLRFAEDLIDRLSASQLPITATTCHARASGKSEVL